jgi:acyl carrier protein
MERTEVVDRLTVIFCKIFKVKSIILKDELTADDVDNWNSLSHMKLVKEIEKTFSIKLKLKELNKMRNVGDMIDVIISKF